MGVRAWCYGRGIKRLAGFIIRLSHLHIALVVAQHVRMCTWVAKVCSRCLGAPAHPSLLTGE
jgi:hypothetical protein